jgi:RNAse (barnase) inhibitor barstar
MKIVHVHNKDALNLLLQGKEEIINVIEKLKEKLPNEYAILVNR